MTSSVLFVDQAGSLGGAELYLLDAIRHTPGATAVTFESGPFPDRLRQEGVDVHVLSAGGALLDVKRQSSLLDAVRAVPGLVRLVTRVARLARRHDVLFLNSQKALLVGALAGALAGRPVIWNLHDILTADHFSDLNRWIAVQCANLFVDGLVANSEATLQSFRESGGRVEPASIVYNGLDASRFTTVSDAETAAIRQDLDIGDAPCVGVFSRLSHWKGQHVLLDALAGVDGLHALIVGDALFNGDHAYADSLRTQADRLGLSKRVHFVGFRDDVPTLMRVVDIVAHTSTAPEPFGRVIVEGQLARRPVVAARAGGAVEIIEDGVNGLLTPPGDAAALARAFNVIVNNPGTAAKLVEAGYQTASQRFSVDRMIGGIHDIIATVTRQRLRTPAALVDRTSPSSDCVAPG